MNFKHLRSLVAVWEEGSFSAAAAKLNIVQPALSQHIIALEREFEAELFKRTRRGVEITPTGKRLLSHALLILKNAEIARNDIKASLCDEPVGEVVVALPFTMAHYLAPRLICAVEESFPRISIQVVEGVSSETGSVIDTGKAEIGVVPNAAELENADAIPVLQEHFCLIGLRGRPEDSKEPVTLSDAVKAPLVLGDRQLSMRRVLDEQVLAIGASLNLRMSQNSPRTLSGLVDYGMACTISNLVRAGGRQSMSRDYFVRRIVSPEVTRTISLAWPRSRSLSRPAACVRDVLMEIMQNAIRLGDWEGELIVTDR
ncbi:LysR family transcriptional regulator [Marinobacterium nitratireducens]|uniref:LysR family transcriptional regulator n=1 Tax=Marinobacterium nitratireducens TaxID=518897 RepID=A0A917ZH32_9GAMM|nr:LysR substrate-binding domain-containing protein [Marinobacterium nitratireducens]GGO81864.1 LysR family transcriptional regulator [Marinobacterium nitratireducens]